MTTNEQRMGRWLTAILGSDAYSQDEPLTVMLVHAAVDQSQRTVRSWRLPSDPNELATMIGEMNEEATEDATQMGGMQRYLLRALHRNKEIATLAIRYNIDADSLMPAVDSEPASARGLVSQSQRFSEAIMRIFVQANGQIIENQTRMSAAQQTMIDMFQKQQIEVLNLQQKLANESVDRELRLLKHQSDQEIALLKEQENQKRLNQGLSSIIRTVPYALHYLTNGKTPLPPTEEEEMAKLEKMLAGMDRATFEKWLAENVSDDEQAAVVALYEKLHGKRAAANTARPADEKADASAAPVDEKADANAGPPPDAPSAEARKRAQENVVALAEAIYTTLPNLNLVTLSSKVLARQPWDALSDEMRPTIMLFASSVLSACKGIPTEVVEESGGPALWQAVIANASTLGALVPAVMEGLVWGALDDDQRLVALRIANATLGTLGPQSGTPAPAPAAAQAGSTTGRPTPVRSR